MLFSIFSFCQNFSAEYKVDISFPEGFSLNYDAVFYSINRSYAYYLRPLYLKQYPDGYILNDGKPISILMDSIQQYTVVNLDSMKIWTKNAYSYLKIKLEKDCCLFWKILPEKKILNNLVCQKAVWSDIENGELYGEIWFCPDINIPVSLFNIVDAPGLVVLLNFYGFAKAELKEFSFEKSVDSSLFWPQSFKNAKFKDGGNWKKN